MAQAMTNERKKHECQEQCFEILKCVAKCGKECLITKTITYSELDKKLDEHLRVGPRSIPKYALQPILQWCEEKGHPPIAALVVRKDTGTPGIGLQLQNRPAPTSKVEWQPIWEQVYRFNWSGIEYGRK